MHFIHTADWQIGMRAAGLGAIASGVRRARLEAARRVVTLAADEQADFLLLAGDTFENNAVARELVREVIRILDDAPCPVYVLPGNHDPLRAGSVWELPEWERCGDVHVFRDETPLQVSGATLYPCLIRERHGSTDPTARIHAGGEGIRVGVAHGSVEGLAVEELEYPVPRDAARRAGLDYLALGHWHSTATFALDGEVRMAYSGTHETTRFGERDSGNALVVEIAQRGAAPRVHPVRTGALRWRDLGVTLAQEGDLAALWKRIEEIEDPASTLLRLRVDGVFALSELELLERLRALSESGRFFHVEVRERGLGPAPADERWLEEVSDPAVREAARRIAGELGDSVGAAERRQALVELYLAMHEVAR